MLMVITSHETLGNTELKTGFWHEEYAGQGNSGSFWPVVPALPDSHVDLLLHS